jgi:hypothetical protein
MNLSTMIAWYENEALRTTWFAWFANDDSGGRAVSRVKKLKLARSEHLVAGPLDVSAFQLQAPLLAAGPAKPGNGLSLEEGLSRAAYLPVVEGP